MAVSTSNTTFERIESGRKRLGFAVHHCLSLARSMAVRQELMVVRDSVGEGQSTS